MFSAYMGAFFERATGHLLHAYQTVNKKEATDLKTNELC